MARINHNFGEEQARNEAFIAALPGLLRRLATFANVRIIARVNSKYMQDAGFLAGRNKERRAPGLKGPLRILTGRLFRGVGIRFSARAGGSREGRVRATIKNGVLRFIKEVLTPYAAVHEFGFTGRVIVPAHTRRINQAFGRPIRQTTVNVRRHSRRARIRARPYLNPALRDELPAISREGQRLVFEALSDQPQL